MHLHRRSRQIFIQFLFSVLITKQKMGNKQRCKHIICSYFLCFQWGNGPLADPSQTSRWSFSKLRATWSTKMLSFPLSLRKSLPMPRQHSFPSSRMIRSKMNQSTMASVSLLKVTVQSASCHLRMTRRLSGAKLLVVRTSTRFGESDLKPVLPLK